MAFDPYIDSLDPRLQSAVTELRDLISRKYPAADFAQSWLDDPEGLHLQVTLPHEDPDALFTEVSDRLLYYQIEEGLPVYVVFLRPLTQVLRQLRNKPAPLPPQANP
jgi:hypothetical protein